MGILKFPIIHTPGGPWGGLENHGTHLGDPSQDPAMLACLVMNYPGPVDSRGYRFARFTNKNCNPLLRFEPRLRCFEDQGPRTSSCGCGHLGCQLMKTMYLSLPFPFFLLGAGARSMLAEMEGLASMLSEGVVGRAQLWLAGEAGC